MLPGTPGFLDATDTGATDLSGWGRAALDDGSDARVPSREPTPAMGHHGHR